METKSAWKSKINWGAIVSAFALLIANFGIVMQPEDQAALVSLIGGGLAVYTWVMRTFFTKKLIK